MAISGKSRVFALLGDPVAHSLSPAMHNAAFTALGIDAVYVALRCAGADVPPLMRAVARAGGGGNVTVPHKETAVAGIDHGHKRVIDVGACNTFWGSEPVVGDNTDVAGVLGAVAALGPPPGPWLIAGTGGAARAAVVAARESGAGVAVRSRDSDRRAAFVRWAADAGASLEPEERCVVLVNATPLGLNPRDPLPLPDGAGPAAEVALDMVYAPGETAWVRALRRRGVRAADGREMLLVQGMAAFEHWFPESRAPRDVMRAALDAALR